MYNTEHIRASLGMEPVVLIVHSIHALMALEYARIFPDKVSHLVLIASSPTVGDELQYEADRYFEDAASPDRKTAFHQSIEL